MTSSIFAFASDLLDEGVRRVLDNVQDRAGLAGITPAFTYHAARDVFPHNPARKVVLVEAGAHYFPPDPSCYEGLRIRPRVSDLARESDVLAETCRAAASRGLAVNAWTVFLHPDRPSEYPDCAPVNVFGDRYLTDFCPANPDVRAYVRALVADVARYEVATILAESLHHHGLEHGYHHERYFSPLRPRARFLLGLCFCEHCAAAAARRGVDLDAVSRAVSGELEAELAGRDLPPAGEELSFAELAGVAGGEMEGFLHARTDTVTTLVAEACDVASRHGRRLSFIDLAGAVKGYATGRPTGPPAPSVSWRLGVDPAAISALCELEILGYAADHVRVKEDVDAYRAIVGRRADVAIAYRPTVPDCSSPDDVRRKVLVARATRVRRIDFYHYGFLRLEALDWVREALAA